VLDRARETAGLLASKSPVALAAAKRLVNRALAGDHEENLEAEAEAFGELFATEDAREGMTAFVEKREPRFSGR
jgi:enoyl-CoA hydratase